MYPYDSLRDYVVEMDRRGRLLQIPEMDQDQYEMTAFGYRLKDRLGGSAPVFKVERTRMNGVWHDTPVVGNLYNSYATVGLALGMEDFSEDESHMYDLAVERIMSFLDAAGRWPMVEPVVVDSAAAPCKEVILRGDDADLSRFPWIMNNPADGGQYISTGAVITEDPEQGRNVGTHRMMIKGSRKVGLDLSPASHAFQHVQRAKQRGLERLPVSVALAVDPITWMMSSTRLADTGEDEFAIAGGFRGKPLEVVRSETNEHLVPAHAEFILEGHIPMDREWEGPYGEMLGYIGEKKNTYGIEIDTITHRENPWIYNVWPGIDGGHMTLAWEVGPFARLKKLVPNLVRLHTFPDVPAVAVACIDKKLPGEGIEAGMAILGYRMTGFHKKLIIVVDTDIDPTDKSRVLHAVGTRWQPDPASIMVKQSFHFLLDPSTHRNFLSSKMVIDATRQLPAEGGPKEYPLDNRTVMEQQAADAFDLVDSKWESYFGGQSQPSEFSRTGS